ncbi:MULTISPECIES: hypothetical protein [Nocardia]|uniref:Uncharacterized protein n=1 Tax=Nocardia africana TaxID=134964 RepID=A0A378WHE0_9NOCA|nr:hypothetical protein [Nocardia africana]MCC3317984.1 hypothetical protein [Nocardia africana]OBF82352.1 hypothetical protein A9X06_19385 [Mycobacterium sp. 852002-51759_SCH5129042]SUA40708.1 Uncharacterised protein [Nocardia africana]
MSWLLSAGDHLATVAVIAQVENYKPEKPPNADGLVTLMRYLTWLVLLAGVGAITFAGGKFAWEKWYGGVLESPKMVLGALVGGMIATTAGTLMNAVIPK